MDNIASILPQEQFDVPPGLIRMYGVKGGIAVACLLHGHPIEWAGLTPCEILTLLNKNILAKRPIFTPEQIYLQLRAKRSSHNLRTTFPKTCQWCHMSTYFLHSHHYPVRKSDGGTDTVNICPNCHSEYHALEVMHFCTVHENIISEAMKEFKRCLDRA